MVTSAVDGTLLALSTRVTLEVLTGIKNVAVRVAVQFIVLGNSPYLAPLSDSPRPASQALIGQLAPALQSTTLVNLSKHHGTRLPHGSQPLRRNRRPR